MVFLRFLTFFYAPKTPKNPVDCAPSKLRMGAQADLAVHSARTGEMEPPAVRAVGELGAGGVLRGEMTQKWRKKP